MADKTKEKAKTGTKAPAARLTWRQAMAWRLRRHHLHERAPSEEMLEVASDLTGLHAQLMSSAQLTLWARVEGLRREDVDRALWTDRTLFKTWAMRGTLHLLPTAELGLWVAALSTYRHYRTESWLRYFGMTAAELERLQEAVAKALEGAVLTRQELAQSVSRMTGVPELGEKLLESWGALLKPTAFQGGLCFAPNTGHQVRFTRPDLWLGGWEPEDPERAVQDVARRFLAAHGPATREDFARWWGTQPAPAGRLIAGLGAEASCVEVDGVPMWMLSRHLEEAAQTSPSRSVRLLPAFDQYVVAATLHASRLMPGSFKDRVYRTQGWLSPVVLVAGRMDGVWRHERRGSRIVVRIEPFVDLARWSRRGVEQEAQRLAHFMGATLDLAWQA